MKTLLLCLSMMLFGCVTTSPPVMSQEASLRSWTDITGRFKINGRLIEVRDGDVFLQDSAGKTIKIAVSRLSVDDQKYLEAGDNPFQMVDDGEAVDSPTDKRAESGSSLGTWSSIRKTRWDRARDIVTLAATRWNPPVIDADLSYIPVRAPLTKKASFHEKSHPIVVNVAIGRAVIGYTTTFAVPKPQTRLSLIDLKTGRSVHSDTVEADMRPIALLDDGTSIVMAGNANARGEFEKKDSMEVWQLANKQLKRSGSWTPYPDDDTSYSRKADGEIKSGGTIDADLIYTVTTKGHVAVWRIETQSPVWHGRLHSQFFDIALSTDRKLMAIVDNEVVTVLDPVTGRLMGQQVMPEGSRVSWPRIAFTPNGKQVIVSSGSRLMRLDLARGDWIGQVDLDRAISLNQEFAVPASDFVLTDNRMLFHMPTQTDLCQYSGIESMAMVGKYAMVVVQASENGSLLPTEMPTPMAAQMLDRAMSDPESFVVHPGAKVSIDVTEIQPEYRDQVAIDLKAAATASGLVVDEWGTLVLKAKINGPRQDAINFTGHGSYIVTLYQSFVDLRSGDDLLIRRSDANLSPHMYFDNPRSLERAIEQLGKQPNLNIFSAIRFPKFMSLPEPSATTHANTTALTHAAFTSRGVSE
ncbi:hypothetical protein Poly51_07810 [Rubripirellula tenax]|uniref:Uncharacterized protein n=1 Tax=Rubripirellula tenax TaxID=2528015 RepID=A0A5C6FI73_9BACT|nr:SHD1 domain-containing protein [Rubripirellula tenax]TWU60505.1 hypothetical protein Poly51_07810 [Rubripirellula tenax]